MKIKNLFFLTIPLVLGSCDNAPQKTANQTKEHPMMGGWKTTNIETPRTQQVAQKAVELQGAKTKETLTLTSIESAQTQVVAGINHKITLKVKRNGNAAVADVIIWEKPDHTFELTKWSWKTP